MDLNPIVPIPYLELAKDYKRHLLLAGLLGNSEYVNFYKQRRKDGNYLILDPGSYEETTAIIKTSHKVQPSKGLDHYSYIAAAEDLGVQEVIVPDCVGDYLKTVNLAKDFLESMTTSRLAPFKLELVPQGTNLDHYLTCLTLQMKLALKHKQSRDVTIGISKVSGDLAVRSITKTNRCYVNRPITVGLVEKLFPKTEIHLLGLVDPVELFFYRYHENITGIDTTAPFNHALQGCSYKESYIFEQYPCSDRLPRVNLNGTLFPDELELAKQNLDVLDGICKQVGFVE